MSKVIANSLGVLATMVLLPGIVAYALCAVATGTPWDLLGFLAAMGVIFLSHFFFLSLTLMLVPFSAAADRLSGLPWGCCCCSKTWSGGCHSALRTALEIGYPDRRAAGRRGSCLLVGSHNYSPILIVVVALESLLFLGIGCGASAARSSNLIEITVSWFKYQKEYENGKTWCYQAYEILAVIAFLLYP